MQQQNQLPGHSVPGLNRMAALSEFSNFGVAMCVTHTRHQISIMLSMVKIVTSSSSYCSDLYITYRGCP